MDQIRIEFKTQANSNMKKTVIGLIVFFVCVSISYFIIVGFFDNYSYFNFEVIEGTAIKEIILVGASTYVIVFIIFLITVKNDVPKLLGDLVYHELKKGIKFVMDANLRSKKGIAGFFILSIIITTFSFYVIMVSTTDVIISLIPGTELIKEVKTECNSLGESLEEISEYNKFLALLVGPIWVFSLRQIRVYEIRNLIPKYRGARLLSIFFWVVVVLFIADNVLELGCVIEREPGMYLPTPPPIHFMYTSLYFAVVYSGLVIVAAYLLEVFIIPKFRNEFTKN